MEITIMFVIEMIAVALGLISVYLTVKQNIWCWPTGLAMVTLYILVFFKAKLYSDVGLQFYFIVVQVYGWWYWLRGGKNKTTAKVKILSWSHRGFWAAVILLGALLNGYVMSNYTDASVPYLDSLTTVGSIVAQWLLGRKLFENWVIWITMDIVDIGIYFYKSLYMTSGLYVVFLILSIMGAREWYKDYKLKKSVA